MQRVKEEEEKQKKKKNYRKDKPWDDGTVDKWKVEEMKPEDNPHSLLEESSFSILFPEYRESYIRQIFPLLKQALSKHFISVVLSLTEGSLTVSTTKKTFDPYIIVKARDLLKLLSRSVPFQQAVKILEDNVYCDIIKISGFTRNTARFVKRRQRLVGPNGMTLKALELLTKCYILVQGHTVSAMGYFKDLKLVRRVVEDTMRNIHPVYHIKELMIKRELAKNTELAGENWDRFLPHFKKQCVKRKKLVAKKKKEKEYTPFPPPQLPREVDKKMESGEYFLNEKQQKSIKRKKKEEEQNQKKSEREARRNEAFIPPEEEEVKRERKMLGARKKRDEGFGEKGSIDDLRSKFLKKKKRES